MNYVEIIARQEELQIELNALQAERVASAQSHTSIATETHGDGVTVGLTLDYKDLSEKVINVTTGGQTVLLSVEDYNMISQFLSKYNDAIFSYMSEITKTDDDDSADAV
tara:strand:- start:137 stop:463 length:327 start_codon:yes stop_codon:yes gene_type:complete